MIDQLPVAIRIPDIIWCRTGKPTEVWTIEGRAGFWVFLSHFAINDGSRRRCRAWCWHSTCQKRFVCLRESEYFWEQGASKCPICDTIVGQNWSTRRDCLNGHYSYLQYGFLSGYSKYSIYVDNTHYSYDVQHSSFPSIAKKVNIHIKKLRQKWFESRKLNWSQEGF